MYNHTYCFLLSPAHLLLTHRKSLHPTFITIYIQFLPDPNTKCSAVSCALLKLKFVWCPISWTRYPLCFVRVTIPCKIVARFIVCKWLLYFMKHSLIPEAHVTGLATENRSNSIRGIIHTNKIPSQPPLAPSISRLAFYRYHRLSWFCFLISWVTCVSWQF